MTEPITRDELRKLLLAIIGLLSTQAMAAVWWAADTTRRIDNLEKTDVERATVEARLVRLETLTAQQSRVLDRIEDKLDRVIGGDHLDYKREKRAD